MANDKQTSGNFGNDSEKAGEAGKKGGAHSHAGSQQSGSHQGGTQQGGTQQGGTQQGGSPGEAGGSRGGSGHVANDPDEKASETGRRGGEHSRGGK